MRTFLKLDGLHCERFVLHMQISKTTVITLRNTKLRSRLQESHQSIATKFSLYYTISPLKIDVILLGSPSTCCYARRSLRAFFSIETLVCCNLLGQIFWENSVIENFTLLTNSNCNTIFEMLLGVTPTQRHVNNFTTNMKFYYSVSIYHWFCHFCLPDRNTLTWRLRSYIEGFPV